MNVWKVILATLVIYSAGLLTGGLLVKQTQPPRNIPRPLEPPLPGPEFVRQPRIFLERMDREVGLSPEQRRRLEKIFLESQERTRILMSLIGPELQAEVRDVREKVRAELRPEQQSRFEDLMRFRRPLDGFRDRRGPFRNPNTNSRIPEPRPVPEP